MKILVGFFQGLTAFFRNLPLLLRLFLRLPGQLWQLLRHLFQRGFRRPKLRCRCKNELDLPPDVHKRPDPMLYSQAWLMSQGLAVTWDNPDIQLYRNRVAIASHLLQKSTAYEVRVRVWNNSYDAPAPGLPVHLSFMSFGVGAVTTYLGKETIDLGAKGSSQSPAFASFNWNTPDQEGHYCLVASLVWADDANPNNNVGQENTNVGTLHSPAVFNFTARNIASVRRKFIYEVDDYQLPVLDDCRPSDHLPEKYRSRLQESRARWARVLTAQAYGKFSAWSRDWEVSIEPEKELLGPREEIRVKVSIEAKNPSFKGRKPFNVHVFALTGNDKTGRQFIGGVTLYVDK